MKKSLLPLLPLLLLSSCAPSGTLEERIVNTALSSVTNRSYSVTYDETFTLDYPGQKYYVGLYQKHDHEMTYFYNGNKRAYQYESHSTFSDIDCGTGEIVKSTLRYKNVPSTIYEKVLTDGTTKTLTLNVKNQVVEAKYETYNVETEKYVPVIFDEEFVNPFDTIKATDVTYVDNKTLTITNPEVINHIIKSYGGVSKANEGDSVTITLDDKHSISNMAFDIKEIKEGVRVQTSLVNIDITVHEKGTFHSIKPFTHNNPNLEIALNKYKDLRNFTYTKNIELFDVSEYYVEGYYTEDLIYYHHGDRTDTAPYQGGDDYDMKLVYNEETEVYDVYQYLMMSETFAWEQVFATEDLPYTIASFTDLGPKHQNVSSSVFKNIGNNQYEAEGLIVSTIGQYFDYEVWGKDSFILETQTLSCVVTLNDNNDITQVEIHCNSEGKDYKFIYKYKDVGTTTIPEWIEG